LPDAKVGRDCNIYSHYLIENDVVVGDRVMVKSGVQLWDGLRVGDDVFIGPNVTFTNDRFPRNRKPPEIFLKTLTEKGASIGTGVVIFPEITIETKGALNRYQQTQLHIEQILCYQGVSEPDWRISTLRHFNPVGAHKSGLIGENSIGKPNNLMPI